MQLSARRTKFVDEYILDANASAAARRAGYSVTSAHVAGSRLLRNDKVNAAISLKKQIMAQQYELTKSGIVRELLAAVDIARAKMDGGAMIKGHCEIAKMLGLYEPETVKVAAYAENEVLRAELEAKSDLELMAIIYGS